MNRSINIIIALVSSVIWIPMILVISLFILLITGYPIFYIEKRAGLNGKPFNLIKFRSMNNKKDDRLNLLSDKDRITKFGLFLRKTSLDEIPELINILLGDMNFIGPRPLPVRYLSRYSPEQMKRHQVRPGLTGWAQINGRTVISWEEKFKLDLWYVKNRSFKLDFQIMFRTFFLVIIQKNISPPNQISQAEFFGSKSK